MPERRIEADVRTANVSFETRREDFPSNLQGLKIEHVLLYFQRASDVIEVSAVLRFRRPPTGPSSKGGQSRRVKA